MADNTRKFVLEGKVDSIKAGIRDTRKELRELQRVQREGGKLTDEQKKRVGELKDGISNLRDESAVYRAELKKMRAEQKRAADASKEQAEQTAVLAKGMAALAAGAAVAVKTFAEFDGEAGRLQRTMKKAGATGTEFAKVQAMLAENTDNFGVGINEQSAAFRILLTETKSAKTATEDLALAIDIAAGNGMDLASAAEVVRKARAGEVEELKNILPLTKDQAAAMAKITDESQRAAAGVRALKDEYGGAAKETKGLTERMAATAEQTKILAGHMGELVVELGDATTGAVGRMAQFFGILTAEEASFKTFVDGFGTFVDDVKLARKELGFLFFEGELKRDIEAITEATIKLRKETMRNTASGVGIAIIPDVVDPKGGVAPTDNIPKAKPKPRGRAKDPGLEIVQGLPGDDSAIEKALAMPEGAAKALDDEIEKREIIAGLILEGKDAEAERFKVITDHDLGPLEKELKLRTIEEGEAAKAKDEFNASLEKGIAIGDAALGSAAAIAGEFIESEEAKAGISAAVETARAIASYATGDIAGGIGHTAAAIQFGLVAGGVGVENKAKSTGGGGAAESGPLRDNEAGGAVGRGVGTTGTQAASPVVINVAFRSVSKPSPEESRVIADAVADEMRTRA